MRGELKVLAVVSALTIIPSVVVTAASANSTVERKQTTTVERDDGDFGDWGLLGLLGLAGVAGLLRRKDHDATIHRTYDSTRKP